MRDAQYGIAIVVLVFVASVLAQAQVSAPPNPYRAVDGWAQLPAGMVWGQVSGVELDSRGNLFVIHRSDPPILKFDASGRLLSSFGTNMFVQAHSVHVDRDGNLWAVDGDGKDGRGHQIFKFDPTGRLLLTLGKAGVAGDGPDTFNRPSDVVTAPNGDVFIVDGHTTNARVMKFSSNGKFITSWGRKGSAPGEFDAPHSIAVDSAGRVFVGDRANNRIQIFDQNGRFLDQWKQFGRPTGLFISRDDTLYVADDESNAERNPGFMPGIRIGGARDGNVKAFIPATSTERAVADAAGNIYGAVLGGKTVRKYVISKN